MSETPRPPTDDLTRATGAVERQDGVEPATSSADEAGVEVVRHEERLVAGVVEGEAGTVRIRKRLEAVEFDQTFPYAVERAEIERVPGDPEDSGEIETL